MSSPKQNKSGLGLLLTVGGGGGNNSPRFVPPMLKEVSKLAAGVASVSTTGSATGNPRNKCVLKPGHSHLDWIRLSNSKDLTGLGALAGQLKVTPDELAKHNKISDGWLAINGKVFNVTSYFPFHPGGVDELKRGLGTDATKLFYEIHSWVNWETLLKKCYVGPLVPNHQLDPLVTSSPNELKDPIPEGTEPNLPIKIKREPHARPRWFPPKEQESPVVHSFHSSHEDPEMELTTNTFYHENLASKKRHSENSTMPIFDWSQKSQTVCIAFSDEPLSNPQVEASMGEADNVVKVAIRFETWTYFNTVSFEGGVQWPCSMRVWEEEGKVELTFKKKEAKLWTNFGVLKQHMKSCGTDYRKMDYLIASKKEVAKNMFLFELVRQDDVIVYAPVGSHYRILWRKYVISCPYTSIPAPTSLFPTVARASFGSDKVFLLIKRYANGAVSKYACDCEEGSILEMSMPIDGMVPLKRFEGKTRFLLISAGTGITPMLRLMSFVMQRRTHKLTKLEMVMVNHAIEYIPFLEEFLAMDDEYARLAKEQDPPVASLFSLKFFLREYDETSRNDPRFEKMEVGEKFKERMVEIGRNFCSRSKTELVSFGRSEKESVSFVFICGPPKFNKLCRLAMHEAEIRFSHVFIIEG